MVVATLLLDISRVLGHKTTVTTERYYARTRDAPAIRRIQEAWSKVESQAFGAKNPLIDKKIPFAGYA